MKQITVIVCTYNRCARLACALESVLASVHPGFHDWELLVVDNNSTDATRQVVEEFAQRLPGRVRYLFEPAQGVARARNAGVRAAETPIIAFTDDDVLVEPGWLECLTEPFADPSVAAAAGPVVAIWPVAPPRWLPRRNRYSLAPLAMFDPQVEGDLLHEPPFGANMAMRREVFARYGEFRVDLGRCGASLLSNEDTEFCERLLKAGEKFRFVPRAVVHHPVQESRISKPYFLRWWFDKARADVRQYGVPSNAGRRIFGVPWKLFLRLARWSMQWSVTLQPSSRFENRVSVWAVAGTIQESFVQAQARRQSFPSIGRPS